MKNRILALILSLAMVFSMLPVSALATGEENESASVAEPQNVGETGTIKYVSIGDSMTNGYGFVGYNQDKHVNNSDGKHHSTNDEYNYFDGTGVYGEASYANQFATWLAEETGATVEHTKMALSAFRAEDLIFMLDDNILKEDWTKLPLKDGYFGNTSNYVWISCEDTSWTENGSGMEYLNETDGWHFVPGTSHGATGYTEGHLFSLKTKEAAHKVSPQYPQYQEQLAYLINHFKTNLTNADVISLALGNAAFDAYFMDRLFKVWGALGDSFNADRIRNEITMFNPMDELVVTFGETEIPLGEYLGYAFEGMNLTGMAYAMLNSDTTYVAVPEVESNADYDMAQNGSTIDVMSFFMKYMTETDTGMLNYHETVAGHTYIAERIYNALNVTVNGHNYEAVVTEATCTEAGYTTYTCTLCGDVYVVEGEEAHGHNYVGVVTEPTYQDWGYTTYTCTVCGHEYVADYVKPLTPSTPVYPYIPASHCEYCGKNVCHSAEFTDLNVDSWYHEYTDYVLCTGLMNGMGNKTFGPSVTTTRAMIVTILYRVAGSPVVSGDMPFTDVEESKWYSDAILWAYQNGIVEGYGNDVFGTHDIVTREQMDTIFYRNAKLNGMDVSKSADISGYADADKVSDWALDAVKWAVAVELMEGRSTIELAPTSGTTRAETATLFYRWCEEIL